MKKKDWTITRPAVPHELLSAGFTPLLSMVLALRGIKTAAEAQTLIYGGEELLCDPMLMLDMDKAHERILRAIRDGETVAVYGDYDVDGITSTCLVTDYLRRKGIKCVPYIPDRNEEGYGLNCAALDTLKAQGVEKIVFVTKGAASAFLLSDLLGKGESGEAYRLTHDGKAVTFTLGEKMTDVSAILTKP